MHRMQVKNRGNCSNKLINMNITMIFLRIKGNKSPARNTIIAKNL